MQTPRNLTPADVASLIHTFREVRDWSQEQLAEISGLGALMIQRDQMWQHSG